MTYEFACTKCTARVNILRPVDSRDDLADCPHCRAPLRRLISRPMLNCDLVRDRPENKWGLGNSEREIAATMKADEKSYNDHWDGKWKEDYANTHGMDIPHETLSREAVPTMMDKVKELGVQLG